MCRRLIVPLGMKVRAHLSPQPDRSGTHRRCPGTGRYAQPAHRPRGRGRVTLKSMDDAGLPALLDAIRHMHGCEAVWVESVPVTETHDRKTVWQGEVQVFDLVGHPKAARAYAWSHMTHGSKRRFVAVLHVAPIDSPIDAVRASIASAAGAKSM